MRLDDVVRAAACALGATGLAKDQIRTAFQLNEVRKKNMVAQKCRRGSDMAIYEDGTTGLADSMVAADDVKDSAKAPRSQLRVVIVEDEAIIAMELEMLLEDLNAEVVGRAMSAADAEALVESLRPDFLTMDINIRGDRDGVTAARDIFDKYGVRSIFISAHGDQETRTRAEPAQPLGWVGKPIHIIDLEEAVRQVELQLF